MGPFDRMLDEAVERGVVPHVVAAVGDRHGTRWSGAAGPVGPDALFRLFSLTKPIGTLAALVLVDRGLLRLDTEVAAVLPEFARIGVLQRPGPGGPVTRPPRRPVTLRHLLTHTSGLATATYDERQAAWHAATGAPSVFAGTRESLFYPLQFDPGEAFAYGIGLDWVGRLVEAVDGRSVDRFCREEVLDPLGMADTVFEPDRAPVDLVSRGPAGFVPAALAPPARPEVYGLGAALHGTAGDYLRFLRAVLRGGELDGHRIVREETAAEMTRNQIGALSVPVLRSTDPAVSADVDPFPGVRTTWTAGFLRVEEDVPGRRRAGALGWAGIANTHAWLDPAAGVAAVVMTQLLPLFDAPVAALLEGVEREVYRGVSAAGRPRSARGRRSCCRAG